MTFQQLSYLLEVYNAGSITQAAKNLYLTQSSVSSAISSLEAELGFDIFTRSKNGIQLTQQGENVIEQANNISYCCRLMKQEHLPLTKRIRISAPAFEPFENAFARLVNESANDQSINYSYISGGSSLTTAHKLANLELDVSVRLVFSPRVKAISDTLHSKNLICENIGRVPVVLQIGPKHKLYNEPIVTAKMLENDMLVDYVNGPKLKNYYLKGLLSLKPERTFLVHSIHAQNLLLSQGSAYAISAPPNSEIAKLYGIRSIPINNETYDVLVVRNPQSTSLAEIDRYIELVKEELSILAAKYNY